MGRNELIANEQDGESEIDQRNKENSLEGLTLEISWRMISHSIHGNKRQSKSKFQSPNSCVTNSTKIKTSMLKEKLSKEIVKITMLGNMEGSILKIPKQAQNMETVPILNALWGSL